MTLTLSKKARRRIFWGLVVLIFVVIVAGFVSHNEQTPDDPFLARIYEAREMGKRWLVTNLRDKGLFVYSFNPETAEISTANNEIRQLMASRILAGESRDHWVVRPLHKRNLDFLFDFWYHEKNDIGYIVYDGKSKLGGNAMFLRTLVASPYFDDYHEQAKRIADGILTLQAPDGSFEPWLIEPDYEYDVDYLLTFYSGEALLALVEYYEKTGDEVYLEAAERSGDFYIDRYVTHLSDNYYPAYVPWHTIAYNHLYKITGNTKYADAIFILNDKLLEIQDTRNFIGRFYNPATPEYGTPHASSDAVYTEGLSYAYEVAQLVGDQEHETRYREAIAIGVENLLGLQYQEELPYASVPRTTYLGAIRIREDSGWVRVDTTQHTIDAFTKILEVWRP